MAIAFLLVLIVVGSVVFHVMSPWWSTPIASNWGYIDSTLIITFWITGAVFTAIVLFMAFCVWKYRHKPGTTAHYEPENRRLEGWLTIATAVGVTAMLVPGLFVWNQFVSVPEDATEVEVIAQQWQWSYRLPGADGRLGTSDARLVTFDNPLGVNPDDANEDAAALDRRAARFLRAGVPRQDGHGAGLRHLFLVHPDEDRDVRSALRRTLRHRPRLHAWHRDGGFRRRLRRLARRAADLRADIRAEANE
jgi:cytochrome c oxidase subunit 2